MSVTAIKSAENRCLNFASSLSSRASKPSPMAYNAHLAYYYEKQPELEEE